MTRSTVALTRGVALLVLGLAACDSTAPDTRPARIDISASTSELGLVGDTVFLTAVVRTRSGDVLPGAVPTWESRSPGIADVDGGLVTARSNGAAWIVAHSGEARDSIRITVDSPIECPITGTLLLPDTAAGALSSSDCRVNGYNVDAWEFELDEALEVTIQLTSLSFDALLVLFNADGVPLASDDDGAGDLNARITETLQAGRYFVYATSFSPGSTGSYELSLIEGVPPSPCPATGELGFPGQVEATVDAGACVFNGFYIDVWRLVLPADTVLTVQVESDELQPGMLVTDTSGLALAGSGPAARGIAWVEVRLPAGAYDVWVGDESGTGITGSYTLATRPGPTATQCPAAGTFPFPGTVTGSLSGADCFLYFSRADPWNLELEDTTDVELAATSSSYTPVIMVTDVQGEVLTYYFGDSGSVVGEARLAPGHYRVWVLAAEGTGGDYSLSVTVAGQMPSCDPSGSLDPGDSVEGALSTTDCTLPGGRYADLWTLRLDTAATLDISVSSDKFDAYLIVSDSTGSTIAVDDDSGGSGNALLALDLEAGLYHIWATSWGAGAVGAYTVGVVEGDAGSSLTGAATKTMSPTPGSMRSFRVLEPGASGVRSWWQAKSRPDTPWDRPGS